METKPRLRAFYFVKVRAPAASRGRESGFTASGVPTEAVTPESVPVFPKGLAPKARARENKSPPPPAPVQAARPDGRGPAAKKYESTSADLTIPFHTKLYYTIGYNTILCNMIRYDTVLRYTI